MRLEMSLKPGSTDYVNWGKGNHVTSACIHSDCAGLHWYARQDACHNYIQMAERKWPGSSYKERLAKAVTRILLKFGYRISAAGQSASQPVRTEVLCAILGECSDTQEVWRALGGHACLVLSTEQLPETSFQRGTDGSGKQTLRLVLESLSAANRQATGSMPTATAPASETRSAAQSLASSAPSAQTSCVAKAKGQLAQGVRPLHSMHPSYPGCILPRMVPATGDHSLHASHVWPAMLLDDALLPVGSIWYGIGINCPVRAVKRRP